MNEFNVPIKTKIAANIMRIIAILSFFPLATPFLIVDFEWRLISYFALAVFFYLAFFLSFFIFPTYLLRKKRWGWWGSVISLFLFISFISYDFILHLIKYDYSGYGGISSTLINIILPLCIFALTFLLIDKKNYWKITTKIELTAKEYKKILLAVGIISVYIVAFLIVPEYIYKPGINSNPKTKIEMGENIPNGVASQEALKTADEYLKASPPDVSITTREKFIKQRYAEIYINKIVIRAMEWRPELKENSLCSILDSSWLDSCMDESSKKNVPEFHCVRAFAIQKKDESLCEDINLELVKNYCNKYYDNTRINLAEKDREEHYNLCVEDFFPEKRNECYKDIAIIKKDNSICYLIENKSEYDRFDSECFQCVEFANYPEIKKGEKIYEIKIYGPGIILYINKEGVVVYTDILPFSIKL
jgi:hypothetical protein